MNNNPILSRLQGPIQASIAFDAPYDSGHISLGSHPNIDSAIQALRDGLIALPNANIYYFRLNDGHLILQSSNMRDWIIPSA